MKPDPGEPMEQPGLELGPTQQERVLEQWRACYVARREEICAKKKAWNKANQKYCQEYYRRNTEKMLEYERNYREAKKARESSSAKG